MKNKINLHSRKALPLICDVLTSLNGGAEGRNGCGDAGGAAALPTSAQEQGGILMFSTDLSSHLTAWYYGKKKKKKEVPVVGYYFHINSLQIVK